MSFYYWLLDRYLVRVLRRELYGEAYKDSGYMCVVIIKARSLFFNKALKKRLNSLINGNHTLYVYIIRTMEDYGYTVKERRSGYLDLTQSQRHLIHTVFWERAITHLIERKQGPVKFNPQDLGIYKTLALEKQHA